MHFEFAENLYIVTGLSRSKNVAKYSLGPCRAQCVLTILLATYLLGNIPKYLTCTETSTIILDHNRSLVYSAVEWRV